MNEKSPNSNTQHSGNKRFSSLNVRPLDARGDRFFEFVVRRLHRLSRVPLVPHIFDALLLSWTAGFNRERFRAIEKIEASALQLRGVRLCHHRFGGVGFAWEGREFGHIHGNGLLDVRVNRGTAENLIAKGQAEPHHVFGHSAWISFWVNGRNDVPSATRLLKSGLETAQRNVAQTRASSGLTRLTTSRQISSAAVGRPSPFAARDMDPNFFEPSNWSIR